MEIRVMCKYGLLELRSDQSIQLSISESRSIISKHQ